MPAAAPVIKATFPFNSISIFSIPRGLRPNAATTTLDVGALRSRRNLGLKGEVGGRSPGPPHAPPVVNIRTIARHSRYPTSIQSRVDGS